MTSHRAYQLYAHITWHTRWRVGCLDSFSADDILTAVEDACLRCAVRSIRSAVLADHVHLLVSYRPSTRLSEFVRLCKAGAAYRANCRVAGAVRWARGYYIASVGKRDLPRVEQYIARQFERHPDLIPA